MKSTTRIAIAGLLSAAGSALQAISQEMCNAAPAEEQTSESAAIQPEAPAAKRGRKPKAEEPATPAPEQTQAPAEPEAPAAPIEEPKEEGESAEAKEARYQRNRGLIEPLVKGVKKEGSETEYAIQPQGQAVKAIIKKYSPTEKLPDLPLDKQSDFEGDIEALMM